MHFDLDNTGVRRASLVSAAVRRNDIFNLASPLNRDNSIVPFVQLRQRFLDVGIELNTADVNTGMEICFELHLDAQKSSSTLHPKYAVLFETPLIQPRNEDTYLLDQYRKIFSWNDRCVDGLRWQKINFPNLLHNSPVDGYQDRSQLCIMIAANKSLRRRDSRELYSHRLEAIRWFEVYAPADFALYGIDWHLPAMRSGIVGKLLGRLHRHAADYLPTVRRPSYHGKIEKKADVLQRSRFAICYENASGFSGYITEKIFDCFLAGCIPVYWGADNIEDHIPAECFVDKRNFPRFGDLHQYLKGMPEQEFIAYQQSIANFLGSADAIPFSANSFVDILFDHISNDTHVAA